MRVLRTGVYLFAEFLFLYTLLVGAVFVFFWLATDMGFVVGAMIVLWALVCVPVAAVAVTVGPRWINGHDGDEWMHGIYQPWRPLAMLGWTAKAMGDGKTGLAGNRRGKQVWFHSDGRVTAYDVIDHLSFHLDAQCIGHTKMGGIIVRDGGTRWGVDPDPDQPFVTVWADTANTSFRDQIIHGVEDFLAGEMALDLA